MTDKTMRLSKHSARDEHLKRLTLYFWPHMFFFGHLSYPMLKENNIYTLAALYCSLLRHAETSQTAGSSCLSPRTRCFFFFKKKSIFVNINTFCLKKESS